MWVWRSDVTLVAKFTLAIKNEKKVFPASCQIIVESHLRIWEGGGDCMLLKCA